MDRDFLLSLRFHTWSADLVTLIRQGHRRTVRSHGCRIQNIADIRVVASDLMRVIDANGPSAAVAEYFEPVTRYAA